MLVPIFGNSDLIKKKREGGETICIITVIQTIENQEKSPQT